MFCTNCGTKLPDDPGSFCTECGTKLDEVESEVSLSPIDGIVSDASSVIPKSVLTLLLLAGVGAGGYFVLNDGSFLSDPSKPSESNFEIAINDKIAQNGCVKFRGAIPNKVNAKLTTGGRYREPGEISLNNVRTVDGWFLHSAYNSQATGVYSAPAHKIVELISAGVITTDAASVQLATDPRYGHLGIRNGQADLTLTMDSNMSSKITLEPDNNGQFETTMCATPPTVDQIVDYTSPGEGEQSSSRVKYTWSYKNLSLLDERILGLRFGGRDPQLSGEDTTTLVQGANGWVDASTFR